MSSYERVKLIRISPKMIILNHKLDYNIYKKDNDTIFKKVLDINETYDPQTIKLLENENIEHLYIKYEDFYKYSKNIDFYLSELMKDENSSSILKSQILHQLASDTMIDILSGDISKRKIEQVSKSVDYTVEFLLNDPNSIKSMIEVTSHDYYTYTHSVDVATYALGFGAFLGLNEIQLKALGKGAMLHDLGKRNIPLEILNKNDKLTDEEFNIIKKHPEYGIEILNSMGETNEMILMIIGQHHEKIDGKGYPKGLQGKEIHPLSQIVAICDIFNALTTRRSYKEPMSSFQAAKLMHEQMKGELNIKLLAKFVKFMAKDK